MTPTEMTDSPISSHSTQFAPSWAKSTNALDRSIAREVVRTFERPGVDAPGLGSFMTSRITAVA